MSAGRAADELWTIGRLLEWTTEFFRGKHPDSPRLDAELLLGHILGCKRIDLYTMYDAEVGDADRARFRELVRRRAAGCPVAYLVGEREFYSLGFIVRPGVLIPRPETERLVEEAIAFARTSTVHRFLDLGAGSGAIAVALAREIPEARGVAVDLSPDALAVAAENARRHSVSDRVDFRKSNLFEDLAGEASFDLIVSNPPYVAEEEWAGLPSSVRDYEPRLALDGGPMGLGVLRRIVAECADYLRPRGRLLLEIGADQEDAARALFDAAPGLRLGPTIRDYANLPRVLFADRIEQSS